MTSMFTPEQFVNMSTEAGFDTKRTNVPEGEYIAVIKDKSFRVEESKKDGRSFVVLDVRWRIDDSALAEKLNLREVLVTQSLFLDVDAGGKLEKGPNKNIALGKLLEALGQNTGPWTPGMLDGAGPCKILIAHDPSDKDPTIKYDRVKAVVKMG